MTRMLGIFLAWKLNCVTNKLLTKTWFDERAFEEEVRMVCCRSRNKRNFHCDGRRGEETNARSACCSWPANCDLDLHTFTEQTLLTTDRAASTELVWWCEVQLPLPNHTHTPARKVPQVSGPSRLPFIPLHFKCIYWTRPIYLYAFSLLSKTINLLNYVTIVFCFVIIFCPNMWLSDITI